jgi:hypothetical protein
MTAFQRTLKQQATYFAPSTNDGFGRTTVDAGTLVTVRWQDASVLFRSVENQEETSSAIVYMSDATVPRGWLVLGDETGNDPKTTDGAFEIRQVMKSPNLKNTEDVYKVFL